MNDTDKKPGRWRGLLLRVISALVLLPIVLGALWGGHPWFTLLLFIAAGLMAYEWFGIVGIGKAFKPALVLLFLIPGFAMVATDLVGSLRDWVILTVSISAIVAVAGLLLKKSSGFYAGIGLAYIWVPLFSFFWMREQGDAVFIFWIFAVVWLMDIGGYFAGKKIGGAKLAPKISPNKTWAGLIGGMLLAALGAAVISFLAGYPVGILAISGAALAVVAQIGDLFESAIKRKFDAKDSGQIIPGHGGILDRVDGLLFAGPVVAVALMVMEN